MTIIKQCVLAVASLTMALAAQASNVGVGVTIEGEVQPGVYGRVDLTNRPPPPLVYAQPVTIIQQPRPVYVEPLYLHVPPGHAKNWRKHCGHYNACGRPVYFVRSAEYEPGYGREHGKHEGKKGKGHKHDHD